MLHTRPCERKLAEEVPDHLLKGLTVTTVRNLDEVLDVALIDEYADWETIRMGRPDEGLLPEFRGAPPQAPGGLSLSGEAVCQAA